MPHPFIMGSHLLHRLVDRPAVAILIPTYNNADTLAITLRSLQTQVVTLQALTGIFIADDCSTDNTVAVARGAWSGPVPLRILQAERNVGLYGNYNRAIDLIGHTVDWLLLMHADDLAADTWLDEVIARIGSCPQGVATICSSWATLSPDGSVTPGEHDVAVKVRLIPGTPRAVRDTLLQGCWWHISGCAIRYRAYRDVGAFDAKLPYYGDWDWLLRCLHKGWAVEYIPRSLIVERLRPNSMSSYCLAWSRDILECLVVLSRHPASLSPRDLVTFHLRRMRHCARRMGRSILTLQPARCLASAGALRLLSQSLVRSTVVALSRKAGFQQSCM